MESRRPEDLHLIGRKPAFGPDKNMHAVHKGFRSAGKGGMQGTLPNPFLVEQESDSPAPVQRRRRRQGDRLADDRQPRVSALLESLPRNAPPSGELSRRVRGFRYCARAHDGQDAPDPRLNRLSDNEIHFCALWQALEEMDGRAGLVFLGGFRFRDSHAARRGTDLRNAQYVALSGGGYGRKGLSLAQAQHAREVVEIPAGEDQRAASIPAGREQKMLQPTSP